LKKTWGAAKSFWTLKKQEKKSDLSQQKPTEELKMHGQEYLNYLKPKEGREKRASRKSKN